MPILDIPTSSPDYQPESNEPDRVILPAAPMAEGGPPKPIDLLVPGSPLHVAVLAKLNTRLKASEDAMSKFHSRWQVNEKKFMAYINMKDFEKLLQDSNKKGEAPSVVSITVPYVYATVWTIVTYLVHTFCGRKPLFQVGSHSKEAVEPAKKMETVLQFNGDKTKIVGKIFQWMMDGQIYGLGIVRNLWTVEMKMRKMRTQGSPFGMAAPELLAGAMLEQSQPYVCYEGNEVTNVDPFCFFPDPRVPMTEVNRRGEFVFWGSQEGIHTLRKAEDAGLLKWVGAIGKPGLGRKQSNQSNRNLLTDGDASPGSDRGPSDVDGFHELIQGTIEIIPAEWGLGESSRTEKWMFCWANGKQIIQAEPFEDEHGKHPVAVIEPQSMGYGFGQLGIVDMLGPLQDVLSWFVNSHMFNVRSSLNNMFVVDPNYVEVGDLKNPGPGKFIRLKPSAMGRDVKTVLQQLTVQDVTANHMQNVQIFIGLADMMSGINDVLRGQQPQGGRRSATESRLTTESGANRMAAVARLVSAQGMTDLGEQMASNVQQYQSMEYYLRIVGTDGALVPINPQDVAGDFYFPIHDGTLPLDRVALLDVWKEIWMAVSSDPIRRMTYNEPAIFEYMAELGGAKNLSQFRLQANLAPPGVEPTGGEMPIEGGLPGTRGGGGGNAPSPQSRNGASPVPFQ